MGNLSVKIEMRVGESTYEVTRSSDSRRAAGASVSELLVNAARAIERAAQIHPNVEHHNLRVEVDGKSLGLCQAEIESSSYDTVLRVTTP